MQQSSNQLSERRVQFRRRARQEHLQRAMNSKRFDQEAKFLEKGLRDQQGEGQISQDRLNRILERGDRQELFRVALSSEHQCLTFVEENSIALAELLMSSLAQPEGVIALVNLVQKSQRFADAVIKAGGIKACLEQVSRLDCGGRQQGVYFWALCQLTFRTDLVDISQLIESYALMELIFDRLVTRQQEINHFIRLIAQLMLFIDSEAKINFSSDFVMLLCLQFWKTDIIVNQINIYTAIGNGISRGLSLDCEGLLSELIRLLVKGIKILPNKIQTYFNIHHLLTVLVKRVDEECLNLSSSCFRAQLFDNCPELFESIRNEKQALFMLQFVHGCEADLLLSYFKHNDLLDYIIQTLHHQQVMIVEIGLKIVEQISRRREVSNSELLEYMINADIESQLEGMYYQNRSSKIGDIAKQQLEYYASLHK